MSVVFDWYSWYNMTQAVKEARLKQVVDKFPDTFIRARKMWVKFILGVKKGLYTQSEKQELYNWFKDVVQVWEGIYPNWTRDLTPPESVAAYNDRMKFAAAVDQWAAAVKGAPRSYGLSSLGVIPAVAVYGTVLVVLAIWGIAWLMSSWATIEEQNTKQALIDARSKGQISDADYNAGMAQFADVGGFGGILGDLGGIGKVALGGAALFLLWPVLSPLIKQLAGKLGGGRG
jgi:hypothetical protein